MKSAKTEIIERKLKPLFWDYVVDPAEAYDVLMGRCRQAGPFDRERLLIRLLVSFTGWNPENCARIGAAFLSHRRYGAQ